MCIIWKNESGGGVYDLGTDKPGRVITFADGKAWFTFDGQTVTLPVEEIEQIISFE